MFGHTAFRIWPMLSALEIPAYLEGMEARGLRFARMRFFGLVGEFHRQMPVRTRYAWDYYQLPPEGEATEELQSYIDFCEGAGWEMAWQFDKNKIFREMPGKQPAPFHTDGEVLQEKIRKAASHGDLMNLIVIAISMTLCVCIVGRRWLAEFAVAVPYREMTTILMPLTLCGATLWYLCSTFRYYLRAGKRAEEELLAGFGEERIDCRWKIRLGTCVQLLIVLGCSLLLLDLFLINGERGTLAGICVGMPIGARIRRANLGMGKAAQKKGMKGIPPFRWWRAPAAAALAAGMIVLACFPAVLHEEEAAVSGSNLYCSVLYRDESGIDWSSAYYMARSEKSADAILEYYLKDFRGDWGGHWQSVAAADVPKLRSVGTHGAPDPGGDLAAAVFQYVWPGETEGADFWLVRQGLSIWLTGQDREDGGF